MSDDNVLLVKPPISKVVVESVEHRTLFSIVRLVDASNGRYVCMMNCTRECAEDLIRKLGVLEANLLTSA